MKVRILIICSALFMSCSGNGQTDLSMTKWERKLNPDCTSYMDFKSDGTYSFYHCNFKEFFSGTYDLEKDTLVLRERHFVSEAPNSTREMEDRFLYKYVLKDTLMVLVYYEDFKFPRIVTDFKNDIIYTKKRK